MLWSSMVQGRCRGLVGHPVTLNPGAGSTPAAWLHVRSPVSDPTPTLEPLGHPGQPHCGTHIPHDDITKDIHVANSQRSPAQLTSCITSQPRQRDTVTTVMLPSPGTRRKLQKAAVPVDGKHAVKFRSKKRCLFTTLSSRSGWSLPVLLDEHPTTVLRFDAHETDKMRQSALSK
jgi:hypothetical protein